MTVNDISLLAYSNTPPDSAASFEWLLWYRLRDIYENVRSGKITKRDGADAKTQAVNSFNSERELFERYVMLWKRIEQAGTQYGLERSLDAADAFYRAVYGIQPVKDSASGDE